MSALRTLFCITCRFKTFVIRGLFKKKSNIKKSTMMNVILYIMILLQRCLRVTFSRLHLAQFFRTLSPYFSV